MTRPAMYEHASCPFFPGPLQHKTMDDEMTPRMPRGDTIRGRSTPDARRLDVSTTRRLDDSTRVEAKRQAIEVSRTNSSRRAPSIRFGGRVVHATPTKTRHESKDIPPGHEDAVDDRENEDRNRIADGALPLGGVPLASATTATTLARHDNREFEEKKI